jgi:hypothetical protein
MPGLMLAILFNNFFVNWATCPVFMTWAGPAGSCSSRHSAYFGTFNREAYYTRI